MHSKKNRPLSIRTVLVLSLCSGLLGASAFLVFWFTIRTYESARSAVVLGGFIAFLGWFLVALQWLLLLFWQERKK